MSKGRKVFLIRNVDPEFYGGGETYQLKLATLLRRYNMQPYIITSSTRLISEAKKLNIKVIEAPYCKQQNYSGWRNILLPMYIFRELKLRKWYREIFRQYRPAVINIQSRDDWIAATELAKKMNIRVLWTDHMDFRSWVLANVRVWYKNIIGKWVLRVAKRADAIIFISDFERNNFEKTIAAKKYNNLVTIKNGAYDKARDYLRVKARKGSFCYVGRLVDYKGIRELIKAFCEIAENNSDVVLNVYGDGDVGKYKGLAKSNRIKFFGSTNEPLLALAENEFFVLPSYREGLSLSLLDAAMMGKKIITSNVDGNPEIIKDGETGLLVPARNEKALSTAMNWMLGHPKETDMMAKNIRRCYEDNFVLDKIFVEKMLPLYNERKEKK